MFESLWIDYLNAPILDTLPSFTSALIILFTLLLLSALIKESVEKKFFKEYLYESNDKEREVFSQYDYAITQYTWQSAYRLLDLVEGKPIVKVTRAFKVMYYFFSTLLAFLLLTTIALIIIGQSTGDIDYFKLSILVFLAMIVISVAYMPWSRSYTAAKRVERVVNQPDSPSA